MTRFLRAPREPSTDLNDLIRPPCWAKDAPCPNACANRHYDRMIHNNTALHGPWSGWEMRGWHLVTPSREKIDPRTLDRWLWRHMRMFQR